MIPSPLVRVRVRVGVRVRVRVRVGVRGRVRVGVVVVGVAYYTCFVSITIHVHTCYAVVHHLQLITMIQLSWRIFVLELSFLLENVSLLDCGGTAISMTRRMSRCWVDVVAAKADFECARRT